MTGTQPEADARGPEARAVVAALPRYSSASSAPTVRWKASSNESTVPPSPEIVAAIAAAASTAHLYPSLLGDALVADLAERLGVGTDQVVVGGGSIALLQQTLSAYTGFGTEVVYGWRSYEAYPILIGIAGATGVPVPLDAGAVHDLDALRAAITPATRVVLVCNPNNPTGTEVTPDALVRFLEQVPSHVLVVLDEAYREFAQHDTDGVELQRRFPNVVVFRTFSKAYGLAGLRAGYLIASPAIADNIRAASPPFGLSAVAEAGARAALRDTDYTARIIDVVRTGREHLRSGLAELGVATPESGANFVWIPVGERALELEAACVARGVSVRAFAGQGVRVTVGAREAEDAVLVAVADLTPPLGASDPTGPNSPSYEKATSR